MNSLSGQSLLQHITDGDYNAVNALLNNGIINLDERDQVTLINPLIVVKTELTAEERSKLLDEAHNTVMAA